jgi:hypothetical protein
VMDMVIQVAIIFYHFLIGGGQSPPHPPLQFPEIQNPVFQHYGEREQRKPKLKLVFVGLLQ